MMNDKTKALIPLVKPYIAPREEVLPELERVLYSGYIAEGTEVYNMEKEFGKFIENPNVLMMHSGTAAIHIALLMCGIKFGDEVISTAMTSEPTNTTIVLTGAKVVWADVDGDTGLIAPESIENKITDKTKAIMVVHYAGMICDMNRINQISKKYNIPVIEDAAHALNGKYDNHYIGSNSKFTCFSFQAIKHLTTVDGGALVINNATEAELESARRLRWFGLSKKISRLENDITVAGFKYGMNNVTAALGRVQLRHAAANIKKHIENGRFFDRKLQNIPGVTTIKYYENTEPSYWLYTLKVENREKFMCMLESNFVTASPLHHRSDTHSVFREAKCCLPSLDQFYNQFVHIPCGWWVTEKERDNIVDIIKKGW